MSLRGRLLAELNRPWRKDPLPVPALTLAYAGAGAVAVTITEGRFRVDGLDGAASFTVDLEASVTLAALAAQLAARPGYTATVEPGLGAVLAVTLLDEERRPVEGATAFGAWTSPNWRVLEVARHALVGAAERIAIGLAQLNLLTAATGFAELWGRYTGTVRRAPVHAPVTGGTIRLTAGSPVVGGVTAPTRVAWVTVLGTNGASDLFVGSRLEVGGVSVGTITAYLPKGASGPGSSDEPRLVLATPWAGSTTQTTAYRIVADPEADAAFTRRQLRELLRPRENNLALARAIDEDTGTPVREVRDLERDLFVVGRTPLRGHPLAGTRYNAATAEVVLEGLPTRAVVAAAKRHAAAGVHVLVLGRMVPTPGTSSLRLVARVTIIGEVPYMQIGVTPIGGGRIKP